MAVKLKSINISVVDSQPKELLSISILPNAVWQYELPDRNDWGERWERLDNESSVRLNKAPRTGIVKLDKQYYADMDKMVLIYEPNKGKEEGRTESRLRLLATPGLSVSFFDNSEQVLARLVVERLQVDCQSSHTVAPVIVRSRPSTDKHAALQPFVKMFLLASSAKLQAERASTIVHKFNLDIKPLVVTADDVLLGMVMTFVNEIKKDKNHTIRDDIEKLPTELQPPTTQTSQEKMYFTLFEIQPIAADISFFIIGGTDEDHPDEAAVVKNTLKAIGVAVSNIEGIPFRLADVKVENTLCSVTELGGRLAQEYKVDALTEIYKVLGCLDIIGNPVKLFGHLNTGISDLFRKPELGEGVQSLASNTMAGALGVVTGITSSVSNSLAVLSMDDDYQRKRHEENLSMKSSGDRLLHGGKRMVAGFAEGIAGIVQQPVQGAQKGGALGFLKGIGKGLVGVVVKPVTGVVDMTTSTINAVNQAAGTDPVIDRVRPPRLIRPDKVVTPFSALENVAFSMLLTSRLLGHGELYWTHFYLRTQQRIVFLTTRALLLVSNADRKLALVWRLPWEQIEKAEVLPTGVAVIAGTVGRPRMEMIYAERAIADHIQKMVNQMLLLVK